MVTLEGPGRGPRPPLLREDMDHTRRGLGAVEGRSRRTLHDLDPLDIIRIDIVQRAHHRTRAIVREAGRTRIQWVRLGRLPHPIDEDQGLVTRRERLTLPRNLIAEPAPNEAPGGLTVIEAVRPWRRLSTDPTGSAISAISSCAIEFPTSLRRAWLAVPVTTIPSRARASSDRMKSILSAPPGPRTTVCSARS